MIIGIGIDVVEVARIGRVLERHGDRFLNRVYRPEEIAYARRGEDFVRELAVRFAAKEAVVKALGTGFRHGVRPRDIAILNHPSGKPYVVLHGKIQDLIQQWIPHVSLSHEKTVAVAVCILESKT